MAAIRSLLLVPLNYKGACRYWGVRHTAMPLIRIDAHVHLGR
ncbi:hypothetical protein KEJ49_05630, partial [Candidatus Bathyarchaeota archaeon]|nr:hypothetical protein [Candidatus Bathyarchaeota archaeon]